MPEFAVGTRCPRSVAASRASQLLLPPAASAVSSSCDGRTLTRLAGVAGADSFPRAPLPQQQVRGMGGKRRAPPSGNAEGKAAAIGDGAAAQGARSPKRQKRGLGDGAGSAEAGSCGQEDSGSMAPVTMNFSLSIRCDPEMLAGLEATLRKAATKFGGREFRLERTRVVPSNDILQRVLPLLLERVEPEGAALFSQVCRSWRRELEARGFCSRTVQLCAAVAAGENAERLAQIAMRLPANLRHAQEGRDWSVDGVAFLTHSRGWKGSLQEWLQAASQECDASLLSRGALSTARCLGLPLVRWVGKPHSIYQTLAMPLHISPPLAFSPNGKHVISGSDQCVKIWSAETGAKVNILE